MVEPRCVKQSRARPWLPAASKCEGENNCAFVTQTEEHRSTAWSEREQNRWHLFLLFHRENLHEHQNCSISVTLEQIQTDHRFLFCEVGELQSFPQPPSSQRMMWYYEKRMDFDINLCISVDVRCMKRKEGWLFTYLYGAENCVKVKLKWQEEDGATVQWLFVPSPHSKKVQSHLIIRIQIVYLKNV